MLSVGRCVVILALCDVQRMARSCLKRHTSNEGSHASGDSNATRSRALLKAGQHKITFLMSWTNTSAHDQQIRDLARQTLFEYARRCSYRETQTSETCTLQLRD